MVDQRLWPSARALQMSPGYTAPGPFRQRTLRSLSSCLGLLATHSLDPTRTSGDVRLRAILRRLGHWLPFLMRSCMAMGKRLPMMKSTFCSFSKSSKLLSRGRPSLADWLLFRADVDDAQITPPTGTLTRLSDRTGTAGTDDAAKASNRWSLPLLAIGGTVDG